MRRDFRRQLLGPEDAVRRQRLVRQPIQLPRRSAVAIPKHFRDICYARRVHGRRRLSRVLHFGNEFTKYAVSAAAIGSRVLQSAQK